jgi:type IV fimbrial biogenesis protein FimT
MIVLAVLAILAGIALPSFEQARKRRHLEGVALQLETDILHARSLSVARNDAVRISFDGSPATSCYVIHTGAPSGCTCGTDGSPVCAAGAEGLRAVRIDGARGPLVQANVKSVLFDPTRGTATPTATIRVHYTDGEAIHQIVNVMGRVRSCAPPPGLPGYRPC